MSKETVEINSRRLSINKQTETIDWIDRIDHSITYDEFFTKYLVPNKPCIFNSPITENWSCRRSWNLDGAPDFDAIDIMFGNTIIPVADCNKKYYNSQPKNDMKMRDYLIYWSEYVKSNYSPSLPLLYLKDWHCVKQHPNAPTYETPHYFASDWLNEYYKAHPNLGDDYMFVYMGPKGSWTPLHADVFMSYSWSANVVGKKRWILFPPRQEDFLRDIHGQLVYDATSEELNDYTKYKAYDRRTLKYIDLIQEEGEIIFVPSGWHHQVWNLGDTVSINHNWINGCNIMNTWQGLKQELNSVMKEVEDCKDMCDWHEHCQLMLKASYGMDYILFFDFLSFIARRRLDVIAKKYDIVSFQKFHFGLNHCLFDLDALRLVLVDFILDAEAKNIYHLICKKDQAHKMLNRIVLLLQSYEGVETFTLSEEKVKVSAETEK